MIADQISGLLSESQRWLLIEWGLLEWQSRRNETAVKDLFQTLGGLGYQVILLLHHNQLTDYEKLKELVSNLLPPQQLYPFLLYEIIQPGIKFKLELPDPMSELNHIQIKVSQSNYNNVIMACQQLLRKSNLGKGSMTVLMRNYELAYWFKAGFFRSFYFSEQVQQEILQVLDMIIGYTGKQMDEFAEEKPHELDMPVEYAIKMLDVTQFIKTPLEPKQINGEFISRWSLKDPQSGKQYEARGSVVILKKKINIIMPRTQIRQSSLTSWIYKLVGIDSTSKIQADELPICPGVPLNRLIKLSSSQASQYPTITHAILQTSDQYVPFEMCEEYQPNLKDSPALPTGTITIDGIKYVPYELGRILSVAHTFCDQEFFDNIGTRLVFLIEKGIARAVKQPTRLNYGRIKQRIAKYDKYEDPKSVGTEKCHFDLFEMSHQMQESFYIGLSCLKSSYLSDVFTHPDIVKIYQDQEQQSQLEVYNRLLETRLRSMETTLKQFLEYMGNPKFPLEVSQFDLKPNLFLQTAIFPYDRILKLKQRVILVHAMEDEMLDQIISETSIIFRLAEIHVELLECRGKTDQQIKREMEDYHHQFKQGECVVLVRNFHRLADQYKMNIYFECGLKAWPTARLLIACPSHYLVPNYQTWFRPSPKTPGDLIEIRIGDVVKQQLACTLSRFVQQPLKYMDLIYQNSCIVDLVSSPAIFNRFHTLITSMPFENRLYKGFDLFTVMLDTWMIELKRRGLYPTMERQLIEILDKLSLNYVIREKRIARLPSHDLWELLYRSNHIGLVRLEEHNGVSFIRNKFSYFYVARIILQEVWKEHSNFTEMPALMRFPLLRKILKEVITEDDKKKLMKKIMQSKHNAYFKKPTMTAGIAISILHACEYDLSNLDFSLTELSYASLHGCNLTNTKLQGANLSSADLTRSYCLNTKFENVRLRNGCKLSEVQVVSMKEVVTDISVIKEGMLLINSNGLIEQVQWNQLLPIINYNLPTSEVRLMRATSGFVVAVRDTSTIEVYDMQTGSKQRQFETGMNHIEFIQLIQSYAVLGRRSVQLQLWDFYKAVKVKHIVWKDIVSSVVTFSSRNILIGDERGVVSSVVLPDNIIQFNFKAHDSEVHCLHCDEEKIITAAEDRTIRVWRLAAGAIILFKEIKSVEPICRLVGSKVDNFLAVIGVNSTTLLSKSLEPIGRFYKPGCTVHSACIDEGQARLYICTNQGISMMAYKNLYEQPKGHSCSVTICKIDDYFNRMITGSLDTNIIVWDLFTYKIIHKLQGHTEGITCLKLVGYDVLASGSKDFTIRLWNILYGKCLAVIADHLGTIKDIAYNYRTKVLFSGCDDGEVKVWKLNKLQNALKWLKTFQEHRKAVRRMACDTQTNFYVSASDDHYVVIYGEDVKYCQTLLRSPVTSLVILGDKRCLCCCVDGTLVTLQMIKGTIIHQIRFMQQIVIYHYIASSKIFISVQGNNILLHTYDKVIQKIQAHSEAINYLAYDPYKNVIATACNDCCLGMWQHNLSNNSINLKNIVAGESLLYSIVQS